MDAIKEIEQMPSLPEMATMALIEGHQGSEYRILSNNYAPGHAMFSEKHMHAYAREYGSQLITARDAEIKESALKYVSLFGELQNAMAEIERLKAAAKKGMMLCSWISESPHRQGSINGLAAQAFHDFSRALNPTQGAK